MVDGLPVPRQARPTRGPGRSACSANHPIDVVLLATDLEESKQFYAGKLGLEILHESEDEITYKCGGDSQLAVTKSTTGTADEQTQAGWRVDRPRGRARRAPVSRRRDPGVRHA